MKTNAASKTPWGKDGRAAEVQALLALTNSSRRSSGKNFAACKTFVKCKLAKMCGGWKGSAASAVFSPCQWHRMVGGEEDVRIRGRDRMWAA